MEEGGLNFKVLVGKLANVKSFLFSRWKLLLLISFIGGVLGAVFAYIGQTTYVAQSTVLVSSGKVGGLSGALKMAQSLGFGVGGGDGMTFSTENAPDIIKSNRIITNTMLSEVTVDNKKDKLVNFYLDWSGIREKWTKNPKSKLKDFKFTSKEAFKMTFLEDSIMQGLTARFTGKQLTVKGELKTGVAEISFSSDHERFTYLFLKQLLSAVSHFYLDESIAKERRSFELMEQKTDSIYTEMISKERLLAKLKDQSFRSVMMQGMIPQMQLQRDIEILNVMYSLALKNLEMAKMTMTEKQPVFQVIDEPILPLQKNKRSKIKFAIGFSLLFFFLGAGYLILRNEIRKALKD